METRRSLILGRYDPNEQDFVDFVLSHYIEQGVGELDDKKLPDLLELKYHSSADAVAKMGSANAIREVFIGFQQHLYGGTVA